MEKNIHDDRLEDFVKKSFEDFEENPVSDMWDRIEVQIPPADERKPLWYTWRGYRWQLAAIAVILLLISRLIYVQFYYEEKLRAASGQAEKLPSPTIPAVSPVQTTILPPVHSDNTIAPGSQTTETPFSSPVHSVVKNPSSQFSKQDTEIKDLSSRNTLSEAHKTMEPEQAASTYTTPTISPNAGMTPGTSFENQPVAPPEAPVVRSAVADLSLLKKPVALLSMAKNEHPNTVDATIKRHKEASGWYAGVSVSPHLIVEKSQKPMRPRPGNPRQLYASLQEKPKVSTDLWLRVGKKLQPHFALESGLGFQQLSRTAIHHARFEYREGQVLHNPGGAESRSFDYDVNTYGGSASVSLRTEVTGNDAPAENERVGALIKCREQIQLLHLPLLGVVRFGQGRAQAVIKAGVLGSYMLKNEFTISAYTLENTKLRLRGSDGYTVQYNRPQHFIFGYQLSAGGEFRLNKNLSLAATPTLSGDFPRTDPLRGKLPGHTAFGVNLGANWWF